MRQISLYILCVEFILLQIDQDKILLQANAESKHKYSIPLIGQTILNSKFSKIENIVASESEILIYCKLEHQTKLIKSLEKIQHIDKINKHKQLKLDVCFELGLDWDRVCDHLKMVKEKIIEEILKGSYPLINYGFQPGFMYLDSLKERLHVPRLENPRLVVPAGSLAIGGKYLGVYGSGSPGGWNIIGRTAHIYEESSFDNSPKIGQEITLNRLTQSKYLRKHNND